MSDLDEWEKAEEFALHHMRRMGFKDSKLNSGGADGGIDIESAAAVAQVKNLQAKVSRPDVQRFHGAAPANKFRLFYSAAGYSREARLWAENNNIALFTFDLETHTADPVSSAAIPLDGEFIEPAASSTNRYSQQLSEGGSVGVHSAAPPVNLTSMTNHAVVTVSIEPSDESRESFWHRITTGQRWYFLVAIASVGILSWVPFVHAGIRQRRPQLFIYAAVFALCAIVQGVLAELSPSREETSSSPIRTVAGFVSLLLIVVACVVIAKVRHQAAAVPTSSADGSHPGGQVASAESAAVSVDTVQPPSTAPVRDDSSAHSTIDGGSDVGSSTNSSTLDLKAAHYPSPSENSGSKTILVWIGRVFLWLFEAFFFLGVSAGLSATLSGEWSTPKDYIGGFACFGVPFVVVTWLVTWDVRRLMRQRSRTVG